MIIYVIVFSLATGILAVSTFLSGNGRPDRTAFVTSGLLVACLLGLREGVGTDFYSIYVAGFNSIDEGNESRFEPGFVLLVRALSLFSSNYNFLFFGIALITVGLVYRAIWRISLNPTLAVFIYLVGGIFFFFDKCGSSGPRDCYSLECGAIDTEGKTGEVPFVGVVSFDLPCVCVGLLTSISSEIHTC